MNKKEIIIKKMLRVAKNQHKMLLKLAQEASVPTTNFDVKMDLSLAVGMTLATLRCKLVSAVMSPTGAIKLVVSSNTGAPCTNQVLARVKSELAQSLAGQEFRGVPVDTNRIYVVNK